MSRARHPGLLRVAGLCALCVILLGARPLSADDAAAKADAAAKPKVELPPDAEKKLAVFVKKASEARGKVLDKQMRIELDKIVKTTGLSPEGREALEKSVRPVCDIVRDRWAAKLEENTRKTLDNNRGQMMTLLDQMTAQAEAYAQNADWIGPMSLAEQPEWAAAVRHALTAGQAAAWKKAQDDIRSAMMNEMGDFIKALAGRMRDQNYQQIAAKGTRIKLALNLPKEQADALDSLAKKLADEYGEEWQKRAETMFMAMDEDGRKMILKQRGGFGISMEDQTGVSQADKWNDGVKKILTADDMKRWQAMEDVHKQKRVQAMGKIMLAVLDEKIAFTSSQRTQLQPIAERLVKDQAALFQDYEGQGYQGNFGIQTFLMAAGKAEPAEITPILDAIQWKHWQEASDPKNINSMYQNGGDGNAPGAQKAAWPPQDTEAEDVESAISDFLQKSMETEKNYMLAANILEAEDAARVTGYTGDRLQTAARGATEQYLASWKSQIEMNVRSQVQNATPQNVRQQLSAFENGYFQQFRMMGNPSPALLDKTLKAELNAAQQAAWKKSVDERSAWRDRAIISVILAEFDRKYLLTDDQSQKLEPMLTKILKDASPYISRMFSYSPQAPWYLQSYGMCIPLAGVPEKDFKAILTKDQWENWTASNEYRISSSWWANIQQNFIRQKDNGNL